MLRQKSRIPQTAGYSYHFLALELAEKKPETNKRAGFGYGRRNSPEIYATRLFPAHGRRTNKQ
jgi:hypothetical protein